MTTVFDAVMSTKRAFALINEKPPEIVLLLDDGAGARLMCEIREQAHLVMVSPTFERLETVVQHPDGSAWFEVQIMGVKVRWPARRLAVRGGDFRWTP